MIAEVALCSDAQRTRETWAGIKDVLPDTQVKYLAQLYNGLIDDYTDALYARGEDNVLLIGHNPTCDELACLLSAASSPESDRLSAHHFGTATLAIIEFDVSSWTEIRKGSGQLVTLLRPRDLEG